ncbi:MAG: hypothetical protein Q9225_007531 [Loekoesia sp. 1 TL-2023]
MLKDQGSWSHDWRVPLGDLEEHWAPDTKKRPNPSLIVYSLPRKRFPRNVRADKIKRPVVWTKASFHDYVIQLVRSTVDRLVARQLYSKDETHVDAVADALENLFADRTLKYVFSKDAANCAFRYFYKVGKFARGRDLFSRLQELQKNTNPSTYNIMLEAAADQKDLFTLTSVLKIMISHNVRPNSYSWLHLARAVQSNDVRAVIINKLIQRCEAQDPSMLRKAAVIIFPHASLKYIKSEEDPQALLEALDRRFGPGWASGLSCQHIIETVGVRHSTQQAVMVLKKLSERGYKPTQGMLLLLLRQCSWTRAHGLAIDILRLFHAEYNVPPSRQIYDVLFQQAWGSRLYNCCRVLWMHACVNGHTSFNMQEKVKQSLYIERSLQFVNQPTARFWEQSAGKVIIGCNRRAGDATFWDLMLIWKPANENRNERDKFLRAVRSMLAKDLAAVGQYDISKPLDELLSEALRVDRKWALGRALKEIPVECKYSQAIDVGLSPKTLPRIAGAHGQSAEHMDGVSQVEPPDAHHAATSNHCWMSPDMRLRPCTCPAYVKEKIPTHSTAASEEYKGQGRRSEEQ